MKRIVLLALAGTVAACASSPSPRLVNGRYYMAGDAGCARYTIMSATRIMCYDKNGVEQGWEDAMSQDEILMHTQQQALRQQQVREVAAALNNTTNALTRQIQANTAQMNAITAATSQIQVQPIQPRETQTRCLVNGILIHCRSQDY